MASAHPAAVAVAAASPRSVEVAGRRRPAGQQRVPGELEHVPAGPGDQLQQRLEGPVEQPPQLLGPARPPLGQPLGDGHEPGDVGQQQRPTIRSACGCPASSGASTSLRTSRPAGSWPAPQRQGHGDQLPLRPATAKVRDPAGGLEDDLEVGVAERGLDPVAGRLARGRRPR